MTIRERWCRSSGAEKVEKILKNLLTFQYDACKITTVVRIDVRTIEESMQAQIAQLVEQRTENPRVTGSIPVLGIMQEVSRTECFIYMRV